MAIERKFIAQNIKEFQIQEMVVESLSGVGLSKTKLMKTPLGDKVVIYASRPGLVVGRGGMNITKITNQLKSKFRLDNPQLEVSEVENVNLDPNIIAERIVTSLERFGPSRFKGVGHRAMEDVMSSGALGVEILISGKIPGARAKRWRFYQGYLKKCGDIAQVGVFSSIKHAKLKSGIVGIQVKIMPGDTQLPDKIELVNKVKTEVTSEDATTEAQSDAEQEGDAQKEAENTVVDEKPAKEGDAQ